MSNKETPVPHHLTENHKHVAIIDLFGQRAHIPINLYLLLIIIVLVVGLVTVELKTRGVTNTIQHFTTGAYINVTNENGGNKEVYSAHIYQFWTPAEKTWSEVLAACSGKDACIKELEPWKQTYITSNKELSSFGQALKDELSVPGYSRALVVGAGKGVEKTGWNWKIIISDGVELDKVKLLGLYERFFHRTNVRIEESYIGTKS